MTIVVSACLLGVNCKYNGGNNCCPAVVELQAKHKLIPVCPEQLGGLPTPRIPSECRGERVVNAAGTDVTGEFEAGAETALQTALQNKADLAVLQPRSPSCGCGKIYDGTFSKKLIEGSGVFARKLQEHGIRVIGSDKTELIEKF